MPKAPLQDQDALKVLETVYSHQLEKQDFGSLLQTLDEAILGLTRTEFEADSIPSRLKALENLDQHFEIAMRLDLKLSEDNEEREIAMLCEGSSSCFAIDQDSQVFAMSEPCKEKLGSLTGQSIERLPLRNVDIRGLRAVVQNLTAQTAVRQNDQTLFVRHSQEEQVAIFHIRHFRKSRVALVVFDHLVWSTFTEDAVVRNFSLTKAECKIVRLLVEGKRPAEIATDLDRSVETIRSHIKSIQSKTQIKSTSALVRLMCEIMTLSANLEGGPSKPQAETSKMPTTVQLKVRNQAFDTTKMVGIQNPDPTRTAMFVHGMLQGPYLTQHLRQRLAKSGIEMVCPSRPGYGATPPASNKQEFVRTSIDHMLHVLDVYKIEKTTLIAHMLGMQFATRFAAYAPDRVSAIISISGVIPMMSKAQLKQQNKMHRMAMLAAKYSPATLGYISQIGERYLREGNEKKCLKQLFSRSLPDQDALEDMEVSALLTRGFQHLIGNGQSAFINDSQSGISDWENEFRKIQCPCTILYGEADRAVPAETLRTIAPQFKNWEFRHFQDAGQTLLHTHPVEVGNVIERTINEHSLAHETA